MFILYVASLPISRSESVRAALWVGHNCAHVRRPWLVTLGTVDLGDSRERVHKAEISPFSYSFLPQMGKGQREDGGGSKGKLPAKLEAAAGPVLHTLEQDISTYSSTSQFSLQPWDRFKNRNIKINSRFGSGLPTFST